MAMRAPTRYVVKPQREGGGNNIYGEDIVPFLKGIESSSERDAYIMMDRIQPPITTNYMVRPATPVRLVKCISELGIFGYIIGYAFFSKNTLKITNHWQIYRYGLAINPILYLLNLSNRDDKGTIMKNKQVGHMLRTKLSDANEGGVAAGLGALDSVFLVDVNRCCENPCECETETGKDLKDQMYSN